MGDLWKSFAYNLIELKKKNVEESAFHLAIENQLQLLGWTKYDGEINHKLEVPIGNHGFIQPDITIGKKPDWKFVIEVKKPSHKQQPKDIAQLTSYMRQLKLNVGLYMGEDIEIFYDTTTTQGSARSVYSVEFKLDRNKRGEKFVELFNKENFTKELLSRFCDDCIKTQEKEDSLERLKAYLISDGELEIKNYVLAGLQDKYSEQFSSEDIAEMLKNLSFSATEITSKTRVHKKSTSQLTKLKPLNTSIKFIIKRNNLQTVGIFDGKGITVKAGSQVTDNVTPSYPRREWRNKLINEVTQNIDGKLIMIKDWYFKSPSGASSFCLGSPSNGKQDWVDENGRSLASYINKNEN